MLHKIKLLIYVGRSCSLMLSQRLNINLEQSQLIPIRRDVANVQDLANRLKRAVGKVISNSQHTLLRPDKFGCNPNSKHGLRLKAKRLRKWDYL